MPCHPCPPGAGRRNDSLEVAELFAQHLEAYERRYALSAEQRRVARDLLRCRTAALGGHLEQCSSCGLRRPAYNSCRNRHCPKCQALAQARWVDGRMRRVLPTHYFHVVFTLPSELHGLARRNPTRIFSLLLRAAAETLLTLGRDPKWLGHPAQLGITAVLHTWTRELRFHPHAHCIATGGGLSLDQSRWVPAAPDFLFPVHVLGALFRGKVLAVLDEALAEDKLLLGDDEQPRAFVRRLERLRRKSWIVYAKRPFGGPEQVYRYLGRYTHRVAISNARLLSADERGVTFRTRGSHTATLPPVDFLRRFLDHILPAGFVKIRHYGLLASGNVSTRLVRARGLLATESGDADPKDADPPQSDDYRQLLRELTGIELSVCPRCHCPTVTRTALPRPSPSLASARAPPSRLQEVA